MTAATAPQDVWGRNARPYGIIAPATEPAKHKLIPPVLHPPYAPTGGQLARFWLAGPLTLLIFIPALMAGIFGAPLMLPGYYFAWRMLRSGKDGYDDFAWGGFCVALAALIVAMPFGGALLYAFGLLFGPLMAMMFRLIAGSWREPATPRAVLTSATIPPLARIPRTQ